MSDSDKRIVFPLALCLAATLSTGLGLIASAANLQWGAAPAEPDALRMAWPYVSVATVWTWLLLWPAFALKPSPQNRSQLLFDFLVICVAAIPACGVAAFLTGLPLHQLPASVLAPLAVGILALGILAWRRRLPSPLLAGTLATLAVVIPIAHYLWTEFFPALSATWTQWMPLSAVTAAKSSYEIVGSYALLGIALFLTAPDA